MIAMGPIKARWLLSPRVSKRSRLRTLTLPCERTKSTRLAAGSMVLMRRIGAPQAASLSLRQSAARVARVFRRARTPLRECLKSAIGPIAKRETRHQEGRESTITLSLRERAG